ncbi:MAG: helix-turn-helix domain-containing protein [Clostridium sp.]
MRDKTVLKVARIRKGYTIEQLAPLVKLSKNTMNKYDKGYFRNIKLETLKRFEEVLGINPIEIYNNMEPLEEE